MAEEQLEVPSASEWVTFQAGAAMDFFQGTPQEAQILGSLLALNMEALDGTFGNVTDDNQSFRTSFELATRWDQMKSIPRSREYLRGYSWITTIGPDVTRRLMLSGVGLERLREAFCDVHVLPNGGVVLRSTPTFAEYDEQSIRRSADIFKPVLLPGVTKKTAGWAPDFKRVAYGMDTTENAEAGD